jgi:hypothetical protein
MRHTCRAHSAGRVFAAALVLLPVALLLLWVAGGTAPAQLKEADVAGELPEIYRIEVEDGIEVGLIQQQLGLLPIFVRGPYFYYTEKVINARLRELGYQPSPVDPLDVLTRVVKVPRRGPEEALREIGVTVVLREPDYWVVRGTLRQLSLLHRLDYEWADLGGWEPRPRQLRLAVSTPEEVREVGAGDIDIYSVAESEKGFIIRGAAFDDTIDALLARGFEVEILPDPPGVRR